MIARRIGIARKGIGGIDEYTSLMLHGNVLEDASLNNVTVSGSNISIASGGKFNKSFSFNGSNSYIDLGINNVFNTYYWTMDWWENRTSPAGEGGPILAKPCADTNGTGGLAVCWIQGSNCTFFLSSAGTSWNIVSSEVMWSLTFGQWTHYAVVRNNGTFLFFKNGVKSKEKSVGTSLPYNNGQNYRINYYINNTDHSRYKGFIEEFRVSSIARWTANFTPPSSPYSR